MTVAVGVGVGTVAGVIIGLMLALGVGLLPGLTGCLLAEATTGVGLMLAVGGSDVLALSGTESRFVIKAQRYRGESMTARVLYTHVTLQSKTTVFSGL